MKFIVFWLLIGLGNELYKPVKRKNIAEGMSYNFVFDHVFWVVYFRSKSHHIQKYEENIIM